MLDIVINVPDQFVGVGGVIVSLPDLDWSRKEFTGDKNSVLDDVRFVHAYAGRGYAVVQYNEVVTSQVTRHDFKPPDWRITPDEFDREFGWVLPFYNKRLAEIEAEQAASEKAAKEAAEKAALVAVEAQATVPARGVTREELEARLEEQEKLIAALKVDQDAKLASFAGDIAKAAGG